MIAFISHPLRALALAGGTLLLSSVPLAGFAQEEPGPALPVTAPNPQPTAPAVPAGLAIPDAPSAVDATIEPGDHLAVSVYGDNTLTQTTVVQSDGSIQYQLIGRVPLAGQTPAQAKETLTRAFAKYVKHPVVSVAIVQQGVENVLVMGNVKQQGRYQIRSGAHVTEALAAAGGVANFNGEFPKVRILEGDGTLHVADLQSLLRKGDASQNLAVGDNATVYVTGAETIRVQVLGAVVRPGNVEVFEGDRLSMALARAGAEAQAKPDLNHVYIRRKDPATGQSVSYEVDLYKALKGGDQHYDPILQKDDTVYVPEAHSVSPATIGILGLLGHFIGL